MKKTLEEIANDLESKYLVFAYRECDEKTEDVGIAIYRMNKSKLETIFNPGDPEQYPVCHYDEKLKKDIPVNELALRKLKKLGVKEVYTVAFSLDDFFGLLEEFCTINPQSGCEKGCFNWCWYRYLSFEDDLANFLVSNGIKIIDYDAD